MRGRWPVVGVALAVLLQVGLSVDAMRGNSATFDEGAHLPAGYTHLVLLDHRLNPEQPPLVKLLAAVPLLPLRPVVEQDDPSWLLARQWEFGRRFLYRWNDAGTLLFLGRLPIVALASFLLVAVFLAARRFFSPAAGLWAIGLAALSPDVLAHGSLVTTDLGFALFFFLAVLAFSSLVKRATAGRIAATGLATGAAFATKFSAPILVPVLVLLGAWAAMDRRPMETALGPRPRALVGARPRLRQVSLLLAAIAIVSLAVVWGSYAFRYRLTDDPQVRSAQLAATDAEAAGPGARAVLAASRAGLVPEDYARGLAFVMTHSRARPTFLLGRLSDHPFPLYFAVTFVLKTPIALLLLIALAIARTRAWPARVRVLVWVPVLVYLAVTATRGLQIGHRHLLPLYPFLFVAAGEAAVALSRWRRPVGALLAVALAAWYAGAALLTHPHHLAYFNELAGGPANGWRLLADSNLDWGQDLPRLAQWMRANGVPRIKLSYFGSADPSYYGIDSVPLPGYTAPHAAHVTREVRPGDLVAVSVTNLQGVYLDPEDRPLMERLRRLAPVGRAGWSIRIYRADFAWPEPATSAAPDAP